MTVMHPDAVNSGFPREGLKSTKWKTKEEKRKREVANYFSLLRRQEEKGRAYTIIKITLTCLKKRRSLRGEILKIGRREGR